MWLNKNVNFVSQYTQNTGESSLLKNVNNQNFCLARKKYINKKKQEGKNFSLYTQFLLSPKRTYLGVKMSYTKKLVKVF